MYSYGGYVIRESDCGLYWTVTEGTEIHARLSNLDTCYGFIDGLRHAKGNMSKQATLVKDYLESESIPFVFNTCLKDCMVGSKGRANPAKPELFELVSPNGQTVYVFDIYEAIDFVEHNGLRQI